MRTEERNLLDGIKARLNEVDGSVTASVQDCLTLAQVRELFEWQVYFELQLAGVREGQPNTLPRSWRGDSSQFRWEPGETFAADRSTRDGNANCHPVETLEFLMHGLAAALGERQELSGDGLQLARLRAQRSNGGDPTPAAILLEMRHLNAKVRTRIRQFVSEVEATALRHSRTELLSTSTPSAASLTGQSIFIGHGRSPAWQELAGFLRDRLSLSCEEFNRLSSAGKATTARLNEMLESSRFAFLVLTAEDEDAEGKLRARENVVHELGLCQGRLGFERAIVLLEDGCAVFSNIEGLGQIQFPRGNILAKSEEIRQVLEREGLLETRWRGLA